MLIAVEERNGGYVDKTTRNVTEKSDIVCGRKVGLALFLSRDAPLN